MGEVRRARQCSLDRVVAIKLIHPNKLHDKSLAIRFGREARLLARLNHPRIVAIHEFGESKGRLFLVMELVAGCNLRQLLRAGPISPPRALEIMLQLCDAVGFAHDHGIVHRDIKPENVLLDANGDVKIADFGLARVFQADAGQSILTQEGMVVGTLRYMSPEQLSGLADIDARADVYALACVYYELLTSAPPHGSFPPPSHLAPVDARLDAVLLRALSWERAERFPNAREMGQAIAATTSPRSLQSPANQRETETAVLHAPLPFVGAVPEPPTRLIGREQELAELARHCQTHRLVTLLGAGGTGKTHLAAEFARRPSTYWPDGAWFVELAEISNLELFAPAIAHALRLNEAGHEAESLVAGYLRERRLLLVLDNFEQIMDAAAIVSRLLDASPGLRILATSRIPLRIRAEFEHSLAPLAVPDVSSLALVAKSPAVQLFVERARAVRTDFQLTADNSRAVAEICRRLDGLPLALELAAARLRLLSPAALAARLDQPLKFLTGGARDLPARQRTLRAAIAWSYDLLSAGERALFRRLSVFNGSFSLEAAEEIWGAISERYEDFEFLDGLTLLVEQSLLRATPEEGRFELLLTLREFAAERLATDGEEQDAQSAFMAWGANLIEMASAQLDGASAGDSVRRLTVEWDNLRAVLLYEARRSPAKALKLAGDMWYAGYQNGRLAESRDRLLALLALPGNDARTAARGTACHGAGTLCWVTGKVDLARQLFGHALLIRRELGDSQGAAATLNNLGVLARELSEFENAERFHSEALELRRLSGDPGQIASSLANLGLLASDQSDIGRAWGLMQEALELYRQVGDDGKIATVLGNLGRAAMMKGRIEDAIRYASEALAIHERQGNARGIILAQLSLAAADSMDCKLDSAETRARAALDSAVKLEDAWLQSYACASRGFVAEKKGDWNRALEFYRESLRRRVELGDISGQGEMIERIAVVLHALQQDIFAIRLLGAEEVLQKRVGYARFSMMHSMTQNVNDELRSRFSAESYQRELSFGAAMSHEEVVRLALDTERYLVDRPV